jgi:peptide/nickel transport system substrate-binding protein
MVASVRQRKGRWRQSWQRSVLTRAVTSTCTRVLLATSLLLLTACSGYQPQQQVRRGGTLIVAVRSLPQSLNPLTAGDVDSVRAYAPLYPQLYHAQPDLSIAPDLAAAMPGLSADGLKWTVPIRAGATWSDGAPITAADVVYTITTESDPTLQGDAIFDWSMLARTDALDAHTVRFTLRAPDAGFAARLVTPIVPQHVLSRIEPSKMGTAFFDTNPSVSGGPYMYAERDAAHHGIRLKANPRWYGGRPNIDTVILGLVDDPLLTPSLLAQGQVLWAPDMPPDAAHTAQHQPGVRVATFPDMGYVALQINQRSGTAAASIAVRQALAAAIDRAEVARQAADGDATVLWGTVSPLSWAYDAGAALHTQRDVQRARSLLAQAHATTPALDLLYPRGDAAREAAARTIAAQAHDAGFAIAPRALDPVALHTALSTGQFMLALTETGMSLDPDPSAALASGNAPPAHAGLNYGGYASARMDGLLAQDRAVSAAPGPAMQAARKPLIAATQRLLADDVPFIPLYAPQQTAGYNITVNGVVAGPQLDQDRDGSMYARWFLAA